MRAFQPFLSMVRWRHPVRSVVKSDLFFCCDTDLILPARFLPTRSSRSQLCLTLSSCWCFHSFYLQIWVHGWLTASENPSMHDVFSVSCEKEMYEQKRKSSEWQRRQSPSQTEWTSKPSVFSYLHSQTKSSGLNFSCWVPIRCSNTHNTVQIQISTSCVKAARWIF